MKKILPSIFSLFIVINVFGVGNIVLSNSFYIEYTDTIEYVKDNDTSLVVEIPPEFPGGPIELIKRINKNIKYPIDAKTNGISGTVYVSFVVEKDGSVSNCVVTKGIGYGCDEEAVRVVTSLPKFIPGTQNGRNVRCLYKIPIRFQL